MRASKGHLEGWAESTDAEVEAHSSEESGVGRSDGDRMQFLPCRGRDGEASTAAFSRK